MSTDSHPHAPAGADDCAARCPLAAASSAAPRYVVSDDAGARALGRRAFISQSVLAAAAVALAACGASVGDATTAPTSVSSTIKVSDYPALASTGGVAVMTVKGARIAVVRTGAASFVALSLVCPHEGGSINPSGTGFLCSLHGARFGSTGAWLGGERTTGMRSYGTTYDAAAGTLAIG